MQLTRLNKANLISVFNKNTNQTLTMTKYNVNYSHSLNYSEWVSE